MFKPPHPGEIILEECIRVEGLSIAEAATKLDVGVHTLTAITEGRAPVTPYVARRLEAVGWSTAESWLLNQRSFDQQGSEAPKKMITALASDKEAEDFVASADLSDYDLSDMKPMRFRRKCRISR